MFFSNVHSDPIPGEISIPFDLSAYFCKWVVKNHQVLNFQVLGVKHLEDLHEIAAKHQTQEPFLLSQCNFAPRGGIKNRKKPDMIFFAKVPKMYETQMKMCNFFFASIIRDHA